MTIETNPSASPHRRSLWQRLFGRFLADRSGATAVEFALVGGPFFIMLMGLVEITSSYFGAVQLENGMETVARQIRTGSVQASNMTAAQFKTQLCNAVTPLIPCNGDLYVDVRVFQNFSSTQNLSPLNPDGTLNPAFQFSPGTSCSIVLARAFYVWHLFTPVVGQVVSNMAGSDRLLQASAIFRNEPFGASCS